MKVNYMKIIMAKGVFKMGQRRKCARMCRRLCVCVCVPVCAGVCVCVDIGECVFLKAEMHY